MRSLCALVLLFAVFPATAQPPYDEVFQTIRACGLPVAIWDSHGVRILRYEEAMLRFVRDKNSDNSTSFRFEEALSKEERFTELRMVPLIMPCMEEVHRLADPSVSFDFMPVMTRKPTNSYRGSNTALALMVFIVIAVIEMARAEERAWEKRPKRVCLHCGMIAQPLKHRNEIGYCRQCRSEDPVALDSAEAFRYFSKTEPQPH